MRKTNHSPIAITMAVANPAFERLEDQLSWYDTKSMENQKWYKRLKIAEIVAAAIIPFAPGFDGLGILRESSEFSLSYSLAYKA